MFTLLICMLTLDQINSDCVIQDICTDNPAVQKEIVDKHNAFRRAVEPTASDMLMMSYDEELAVSARSWADKCILAHGPPSTHQLNGYVLGENLFFSSKPHSWTDVITSWHSEVSVFVYPTGPRGGHYTQVVWNSSYRVGCAMKFCPDSRTYFYACHYYRAGNFYGWRPYTAGPWCASCPNDCEEKLCTNPCPVINYFLNCPQLKTRHGCSNKLVHAWCPASCRCTDEIVPVA